MSQSVTDRPAAAGSGYVALACALLLLVVGAGAGLVSILRLADGVPGAGWGLVLGVVAVVAAIVVLTGIYSLQPNESAVLTLFGEYAGTDSNTGLRWANPLYAARKVSCRLQTHHIEAIKVNDALGNPIEIGAAIVWHVRDSAKAVLEVDDFRAFVELQSETALRKIASSHPYDNWTDQHHDDAAAPDVVSLRGGGDEVSESLAEELRGRFLRAGIEAIDARITHLAYAPEIANAMLRRQQAAAVVAARRTIVQGAVELVKEALMGLKDKSIEIDPERQAAMVSNMLVVLVGDKDATPVINTGTLHG